MKASVCIDVIVVALLEGELNIEPHRHAFTVLCTSVARFHDPWTTASDHTVSCIDQGRGHSA